MAPSKADVSLRRRLHFHSSAVALFLSLAAVDHLLTSTVARRPYEDDLRRGINRFRWGEYSLSATLEPALECFGVVRQGS